MFLHIANADLEFEIVDTAPLSLEQSLRRNLIVHQLQFLPILYADKGDGLCVTDAPYPSFDTPKWHLLSDQQLPYSQVQSWAPSKQIAEWAKKRGLIYLIPPWDVVKEVNSKAFSFQQTEPLPQAELLYSWDQVQKWIKLVDGPKVLKTCFGVSGKGHLLLPTNFKRLETFVMKELNASRPIIGEPWVVRKLDFSTQWIISEQKEIQYVGSTILKSDARGHYVESQVGNEEKIFGSFIPKLHEHKICAQKALQKMASLGFFGNVGIDAMIWGDGILHAVVEINARKTMGWIALQIAKRLFPNQTITVSYTTAGRLPHLLPEGFMKLSGEVENFSRNLHVDVLAN